MSAVQQHNDLARISAALERIAAALEGLESRAKTVAVRNDPDVRYVPDDGGDVDDEDVPF